MPIKSTTKVVTNAIKGYATFNQLMVSENQTFSKITVYDAPALNQIKQFRQN